MAMTSNELRAALKELGWSAPHLAKLLGVGEKTPTNWMLKRARVPDEVGPWLKRCVDWHRMLAASFPYPAPPRAAAGKEGGGD